MVDLAYQSLLRHSQIGRPGYKTGFVWPTMSAYQSGGGNNEVVDCG